MKQSPKDKSQRESEEAIVIYLTGLYRRAEMVSDAYRKNGELDEMYKQKLAGQLGLMESIERVLKYCSPSTRFIIIHNYIRKEGSGWYYPFYARSTFYRLKNEAIHEFTQIFNQYND